MFLATRFRPRREVRFRLPEPGSPGPSGLRAQLGAPVELSDEEYKLAVFAGNLCAEVRAGDRTTRERSQPRYSARLCFSARRGRILQRS